MKFPKGVIVYVPNSTEVWTIIEEVYHWDYYHNGIGKYDAAILEVEIEKNIVKIISGIEYDSATKQMIYNELSFDEFARSAEEVWVKRQVAKDPRLDTIAKDYLTSQANKIFQYGVSIGGGYW